MNKITKNGMIKISEEEKNTVDNLLSEHSKDLHYLLFDRQLTGFCPVGCFLLDNDEIRSNELTIVNTVITKQRICSLYPKELFTIYPFKETTEGNLYTVDFEHIDRHFDDILELNDNVYKTKYMYVDFGHSANNMNYSLIEKYLRDLIQKSNILEAIYYFYD